MPGIAIILGSESDMGIADQVTGVLDEGGYDYDLRIISAHRDPEKLDDYIRESDALVFIAIAGLSAALPGVVAARTSKPVIGVPASKSLGGLDALLSIAQMPPGVPVACVGIDNGGNAAHLAIRMLLMRDSIGGTGGSASPALQSEDSPPPPLHCELKDLSRIPSSSTCERHTNSGYTRRGSRP